MYLKIINNGKSTAVLWYEDDLTYMLSVLVEEDLSDDELISIIESME
ncbi:hypothetical protein J2R98_001660 [Alkalibacillus filiformis]|uniref:DUF4367 domain-containing protein n=1 Tax=Alkalibacillus filiformis TaxID=200990 RepID=A0ABU0DTP9_9BACI|nr:hypothetical protein [Alkalibacillus filiformis]